MNMILGMSIGVVFACILIFTTQVIMPAVVRWGKRKLGGQS